MFKKKGQGEEFDLEPVGSLDEDWLEAPSEGQLNLDLVETANELVVIAPVAGVPPEDIEIKVKDNVLTIRGERKAERTSEEDNYHIQETYWGAFSRAIALPNPVDVDKAKVTQDNGVLEIRLPKLTPSSEVTLKVKPKNP